MAEWQSHAGAKIYLAGKIAGRPWRNELVKPGTKTPLVRAPSDSYSKSIVWPVLHRAIFNRFDYVGPFYTELGDHNDPLHAFPRPQALLDPAGGHCDGLTGRNMIFRACKKAIQEADLVFAWLTGDDDIIGTAWELGFAEGIRKPVVIGIPDGVHNTIPWFLEEASPYVVSGPNPETALKDFLVWLHWFFDSPPELTFWQQWGPRQWGELNLNIQHEVFGGRYRLDFAHLSSQVAIEIDGFTYHGDDAHFTNDRKRDRELSEAGWKVCRFTAKEVMAAPEKCCKQAEAIIRQNVAA